MVVRPDLCTAGHTIHGGAVMAFADSVGAAATVINLPADAKGVIVAFLRPQGSAQSAGLANGDVVQQINQTPVTDVEQFKKTYQALRKDKPQDAVVLEVLRGGSTQIIRIEPPRE